MDFQMSVVSGVLLLFSITVVIYGYASIKKSIPLKYVRRCELRERFKAFINIALSAEFNERHLSAFWEETQDCNGLFTSYSVLRLRRELFDHGKLLLETQANAGRSSKESQQELHLLTDEALDWFRGISTKIDGAFRPETTKNTSLRYVLEEAFRITGRSLGT